MVLNEFISPTELIKDLYRPRSSVLPQISEYEAIGILLGLLMSNLHHRRNTQHWDAGAGA
jgi:hypothetical protein